MITVKTTQKYHFHKHLCIFFILHSQNHYIKIYKYFFSGLVPVHLGPLKTLHNILCDLCRFQFLALFIEKKRGKIFSEILLCFCVSFVICQILKFCGEIAQTDLFFSLNVSTDHSSLEVAFQGFFTKSNAIQIIVGIFA